MIIMGLACKAMQISSNVVLQELLQIEQCFPCRDMQVSSHVVSQVIP